MKLLLATALAALLLAPQAAAHVESYSQTRTLQAGPFLIFFEPRPIPPFAESPASMVAQISDAATGSLLRSVPVTVLVAGPDDFSLRKKMEGDGTGYMIASLTLPARGNYSARIFVTDVDTNETYAADTEFEVFPNIPYRIRPVDQSVDVYVGQRTPLAFEIVSATTLAPTEVADLAVRAEHWTEDHTTFLGATDAQTERVGRGVWRIDHTFPAQGMYHMRFASNAGGFNYDDVPLLHVYALSTTSAGVDEKEAPAAPLALVGLLVALVALALRRR